MIFYIQFGLVHISTGDLLRAEVSAATEIGNKAKEYMNAGQLVPDEIVTEVMNELLYFSPFFTLVLMNNFWEIILLFYRW